MLIRSIGCGTGRCGTRTLAKIIGVCDHIDVTHEQSPCLPWVKNMELFLKKYSIMNGNKKGVGDVAFSYLPYLEDFIKITPEIRIIILKRIKEDVIKSFQKWKGFMGFQLNKGFPPVVGCNLVEQTSAYWDIYYEIADKLIEKYPENIKMFLTEDLSKRETQIEMMDFVGIKEKDRRFIDNTRYN